MIWSIIPEFYDCIDSKKVIWKSKVNKLHNVAISVIVALGVSHNLLIRQKWTSRQNIFNIFRQWANTKQFGFKPVKESTKGFHPLIFYKNVVLLSRSPIRVFQLTRSYCEGRWRLCDPTRRICSELSCCVSDSVGWDVKMSGDARRHLFVSRWCETMAARHPRQNAALGRPWTPL